jgi:hypothetical protein
MSDQNDTSNLREEPEFLIAISWLTALALTIAGWFCLS